MNTATTSTAGLKLTGRTIRRQELSSAERGRMFELLTSFFSGVEARTFDDDLREKSHVILLEDDAGVIHGFSTLLVYRTGVPNVDAMVVYSGDTIVDREWWGSPALAVSWLRAARSLTRGEHTREVYWLLLTSGFRTYRFLPVFWRDFWPRHDAGPNGVTMRPLADSLAREKFQSQYDSDRGIVRFARPQVLVPELLDVPAGRTHDAHVAFFLERNPGYIHGDELVCVTRIDDDANLTPAGRRIARHLNGQ
jgi:hypothetical protein